MRPTISDPCLGTVGYDQGLQFHITLVSSGKVPLKNSLLRYCCIGECFGLSWYVSLEKVVQVSSSKYKKGQEKLSKNNKNKYQIRITRSSLASLHDLHFPK